MVRPQHQRRPRVRHSGPAFPGNLDEAQDAGRTVPRCSATQRSAAAFVSQVDHVLRAMARRGPAPRAGRRRPIERSLL